MMPLKKAMPAKTKGKNAPTRRKRKTEGVPEVWGSGAGKSAKADANGKNGGPPRRKRNPPSSAGESEEVRKANELLLEVWESIYARRDELKKELYWAR